MRTAKPQVTPSSSGIAGSDEPPITDNSTRRQSWIAVEPAIHYGLLLVALVFVGWVRLLPLSLGGLGNDASRAILQAQSQQIAAQLPAGTTKSQAKRAIESGLARWRATHAKQFASERNQIVASLRSQLTYKGADGKRHVFLGGYDGYQWLRMARNYLRTGHTCDAFVKGQCIDTYANAPVGRVNIYAHSLHIDAIIALDRVMTFLRPGYPLASASFLVPVIIGLLGVFPAFAIGRRLAGNLSGLCAAITIGVNPLFLRRSVDSDNDVWNIVLPLFLVWAALEAGSAERPRRQIAYALLAAFFVGLHAATWSGWPLFYGVVLLAMVANVGLEAMRTLVDRYRQRTPDTTRLRRAALVTVVFYAASAVFAKLGGAKFYFSVPLVLMQSLLGHYFAHNTTAIRPDLWPNVFATVAELQRSSLAGIAAVMGGQVLFFASWLGLLLLLVPRRGWQIRHYLLLIGGNYLYWYLLTANPGRMALLALLASPIALALLIDLFTSETGVADPLGALIVGIWFLATMFLSFQGSRFAMLLVAPFGIALGVALGRLHQWLDERLAGLTWSRSRPMLRAAAFLVVGAVLIVPARRGYAAGLNYIPRMNVAWWATLKDLRKKSPPDSIVTSWWDYGYWIEYVANRRATVDGGSLDTHIPYWVARVLAAPTDRESAGLLMMLDCGSDATPLPQRREGAYGKLRSYGADTVKAEMVVSRLATLDRAQAESYLAENKFSPTESANILSSAQCQPPPGYLVVTSAIGPLGGWWHIGNWNFERAYILKHDSLLPESTAVADIVSRFGDTAARARALYEKAKSVRSRAERSRFVEPSLNYLHSGWFACRPGNDASMVCDANLAFGRNVVKQFIYYPDDPTKSRIILARGGSGSNEVEGTPGLMVVAGRKRLHYVSFSNPSWPGAGVLMDVEHSRARLGSPELLRSTFARLFYLDGRYDKRFFSKAFSQVGFAGEQVTAWRVNWNALEENPDAPRQDTRSR